jgi:hypothetical protein
MAPKPLYTREIADRVLELICDGMSMREVSRLTELPCRKTLSLWISQDIDGFKDRYYVAQQARVDMLVEDTIDIADGTDGAVGEALDPANKKVRIDARRWIAARSNRLRWGDHIALDIKATTVAGSSDADLIAVALGSRNGGLASEEGEG